MTQKEALAKGRAIRQEKLLKALYEENKAAINKNHAVSYTAFKNRIQQLIKTNPRYEQFKEGDRLVAAGRKHLHTLEFVSRDEIGIENIKEGLKSMKTGRKIKWGREITPPGTPWWVRGAIKYKEETMFDVFRRIVGVGRKFNIYWNEESRTYRFTGKDGNEYEIIVSTSPTRYGIQMVE